MLRPAITLTVYWLLALVGIAAGAAKAQTTNPSTQEAGVTGVVFEPLDYQELSRMEFRADYARRLYWKGDYTNASQLFGELGRSGHPSTPLYLNERASCRFALGQYQEAIEDLRAASMYLQNLTNSGLEKKAIALYGREVGKVYYGDPYERAMEYLWLALAYMDQGDYDNALAACKSGILADSDALENRYESDFTLLYLLEAKCYLLRGEAHAAEPVLVAAKEAYCLSHPAQRDLVANRANCIAGLRLSKKERREQNLPETEAALKVRIGELDEAIRSKASEIDAEKQLGLLRTGDFNTLVVVPRGRSPTKIRQGAEGHIVVFSPQPETDQPVTLCVDGQAVICAPIDNTADVTFQATTRGGRQMDSILKGKVAFKSATVTTGRVITEVGNAVGSYGLPLALLGGAVQGMGGAISPEADTRCWKTLPAKLRVYALKLPDGPHELICYSYIYFEKVPMLHRFELSPSRRFAVAIAPSMSGHYSEQVLRPAVMKMPGSGAADRGTATGCDVLIPPPMGLGLIERFPSPDQKSIPRAFAPDPKKMAGLLEQALVARRYHPIVLSHDEIVKADPITSRSNARALQVEFMSVDMQVNGKEESYGADFLFKVINSSTGEIIFQRHIAGKHVKHSKDKGACTEAFYACFQQALEVFFENSEAAFGAQNPSPQS
jgi:tetratricopeptide (TPR) repeat protein